MDSLSFRPFLYWCHRHQETGSGALDSPGQANCYTLWAQLEGTGILATGEQRVQLRPGKVALSDPGAVLRWRGSVAFLRLAFDLVDRPRRREGGDIRPRRWTPQPPLVELFGCDLAGLVSTRETAPVLHLLHAANTFWWRSAGEQVRRGLELGRWLLDYAERSGAAGFDPWALPREADLADRTEAILEHQPGWGIAAVAAHLGVSREHLSRSYRRRRGVPPQDFQLRCRLRATRSLLEQTDASLAEVARRGGFGSVEAMRRTFVRELGLPPGRYRERHRDVPHAPVERRRKGPVWDS